MLQSAGSPQAVPNSTGLPLDDIIAVLLLIWFGVQTLRRCAYHRGLLPAVRAGCCLLCGLALCSGTQMLRWLSSQGLPQLSVCSSGAACSSPQGRSMSRLAGLPLTRDSPNTAVGTYVTHL